MMTPETVEAELEHDGSNGNGSGNSSPLSGLKGILEAILFVSGEPLSVDRVLAAIDGVDRAELTSALRALHADYAAEGRGLPLVGVAGGFQISTGPDCAPGRRRLERGKESAGLSRSVRR